MISDYLSILACVYYQLELRSQVEERCFYSNSYFASKSIRGKEVDGFISKQAL